MAHLNILRTGLLLSVLTAAFGAGGAPVEAAEPQRPNIVFLFSDDHAIQAISAYGSRINRTPNIDRLAFGPHGFLFDRAYCENSICAPSRAAILTGTYSHEHGVITNRETFDGSQITFPKVLQQAGYTTALFGKWHLKSEPTGFDEWAVYEDQGRYYRPLYITADGEFEKPGYSVHNTTDMALEYLRRQAQQADGDDASEPADPAPFLLMLQFKAPHRNWMPPLEHLYLFEDVEIPEPPTLFDDYATRGRAEREQEMEIDRHMTIGEDIKGPAGEGEANWHDTYPYFTPEERAAWDAAYGPRNDAFRKANPQGRDLVRWKYQRYIKDYLRTVQAVDDAVGRVLDELDALGLADNTIVVYSSDQGFFLGEHGWFDKRWMYEESARMPLAIRWPASPAKEGGRRITRMVQNIDFGPTLLDAAGVEAPERMRGESFAALMEEDDGKGGAGGAGRDHIYYRYYGKGWHAVAAHFGVHEGRYKVIRYPDLDEWGLFDLEKDPQEMRNVWNDPAYAEVQERMLDLLWKLQREAGDTPEGVSPAP